MGQILDKIYYAYDDVTIMPGVLSKVEHRTECIPWDKEGMLPLFTAPMDTVVSKKNFELFQENKIHPILPRTESIEDRINYACDSKWAAFSLQEFEKLFTTGETKSVKKIRVLIDIANGHMEKVVEVARKAKEIYGNNIEIMAGNIANPETYLEYAKAGIDYVRCSIGTGCGCLSSSNTGVHVPPATLINDIAEEKLKILGEYYGAGSVGTEFKSVPEIIADGGIRNYRDVIKALALGADYYIKAIKYMSTKYTNPRFFIFSNDSEWCKENIASPNSIYVDWNTGNDSIYDMYLMSKCESIIIANSTFSYWAAKLNSNADIVVYPLKWFKQRSIDLFPDNWVGI